MTYRTTPTRRPRRPDPAALILVPLACAEPGCEASTEVEAGHVDRLSGRWRCRVHYLGIGLGPA
jgi:hypothetical protein